MPLDGGLGMYPITSSRQVSHPGAGRYRTGNDGRQDFRRQERGAPTGATAGHLPVAAPRRASTSLTPPRSRGTWPTWA